MSMPLGEHDVCRHLEMAQRPDGYRRMGTIPLATRASLRHTLQGLYHQVGDLRNALANEELNADGAVVDLTRMISSLQYIKRRMEAK